MSRRTGTVRLSRAIAVAVLGSGAILFGTTSPASANTNFNGNCESSEACVWAGDIFERGTWDYEGTDHDFRNNFYPTLGTIVDRNSGGFSNSGTSCRAVLANNYGSASAGTIFSRLPRGGSESFVNTRKYHVMSQLYWEC